MRLYRRAIWVLINVGECYLRADAGILLFYFVQYCSDSSGTAMIVTLLKSDQTMIIRLSKSDRL